MKTKDTLREKLQKAFEKDYQQFVIQSLTPDRGYEIPVDNLLTLFEAENAELREALELCLSTITKSDPQTNPGAYEVATLKARRALEGKP